tara:strand:+ start:3536 stop:4609 length:1074 start_codon:yes stop_codon:yes gene_type:complete
MDKRVFDKLDEIVIRFNDLEESLSSKEVVSDHKKSSELAKSMTSLEPIVEKYREYQKLSLELSELEKEKYDDEDMSLLVEEEKQKLKKDLENLDRDLQLMLLPKDKNDEKNVIVEIRAGAGGEEAAIFVSDIFRMYQRYITELGWRIEPLNFNEASSGGFKEVVFMVKGKGVYSKMKFESGVHRVQRIPKTESSGRIHTSTITVAVLPEADDVSIHVDPKDIQVDVYRSSGAGGQSVNTTDSAVRITHFPTGLVVTCQDERSQIKNREKAMKILKTKLYDLEEEKKRKEIDDSRKLQVGRGDRSEKVRTYNYPQGRVTDHRINLTLHKLDAIMNGDMKDLIDSLMSFEQAEKLKQGI